MWPRKEVNMVTICDYQSVALVVTLAMLLRLILINCRFIIIIEQLCVAFSTCERINANLPTR